MSVIYKHHAVIGKRKIPAQRGLNEIKQWHTTNEYNAVKMTHEFANREHHLTIGEIIVCKTINTFVDRVETRKTQLVLSLYIISL
jgi:hypothetical protein